MRAPLCSDTADSCPDDKGLIGSETESQSEIQAIEKALERSHSSKTAVFGICLDNLMGTTPQVAPQIPFILSRLCRYIEEHGMHHKKLFLESDEKSVVENLKLDFIESGDAPLEESDNVTSAAKLIVIFFEELPEPLIPLSVQHHFIKEMEKFPVTSSNCALNLKHSVQKLPDSSYHVLKYLSRFLLKVAYHKETNGMSSDNLAVIFGPVLFRTPTSDQALLLSAKNIVNYFVKDYYEIFEDHKNPVIEDEVIDLESCVMSEEANHRSQVPCPSSIMPMMTLSPLSVFIPLTDSNLHDTKTIKMQENVPVLLIENHSDSAKNASEQNASTNETALAKGVLITRKRKERRLSGDDVQPRSSSEERPPISAFVSLEKIELMRRCNSHEEVVVEGFKAEPGELSSLYPEKSLAKNNMSLPVDSYVSGSLELVVNEKNHSPHPPNAKRREVETRLSNLELQFPWKKSNNFQNQDNDRIADSDVFQYGSIQNSIAEIDEKNTMDCNESEDVSEDGTESSSKSNSDDTEFFESRSSQITRSTSCPLLKEGDTESSSEAESNSLSLSWSMLFEDSEPVRSDHHLSWPLDKSVPDDDALLSPSVQSLRKSSFYEAPLSPSAYRSYLSHRSSHLDSSVPPSPPVEQEDFAKALVESNAVADSIKRVTKKIHGIKKRIRKFDEKFEIEFGYKPSHAEKSNNPEAKKLLSDLYKARKELKALREESNLDHVSAATSWQAIRSTHILGDSTNQLQQDCTKEKARPSLEDSFGVTMKSLSDERKIANRPELVEDMSTDQVKEEKVAIQKALLNFESIHGKPSTKQDRNTIRPLYDRYRSVKRLLVRSGSFPGATSKNKELCSDLQPILEHETMNFSSSKHRVEKNGQSEPNPESGNSDLSKKIEETMENEDKDERKGTSNSRLFPANYTNPNIHELPLSEMIFQLQQVKTEKRHLRKILREFESEFCKLNGRKVQKEDKAPVDTLYYEYKHVKARLKLLEALISKHDQHQLM